MVTMHSIVGVFGPLLQVNVHSLFSSQAKFQTFLFLWVSLLNYSEESIFSSLIRNNLNRYLKNPMFTKSFVRNSAWPNEQDDHGSSALISPQNGQIGEFIKSQNKFASDHLMEPFGSNYNFDLMSLNNEFPGIIASQTPQASAIQNHQRPNHQMISPPAASASNAVASLLEPKIRPNNSVNFFDDKQANRFNSKSLTVSESKINAYSDSNKLKNFNKHSNLYNNKKLNNTNKYIDAPHHTNQAFVDLSRYNVDSLVENKNFENHLFNGNKYNQEKALNLKMEYGFRPLPQQKQTPQVGEDFRTKDFTVTNSIQLNDAFEYLKPADLANDLTKENDNDDNESGNNNIYSSAGNEESSNRSMKSLQLDSHNTHNTNVNNHLDEFAPDYKKYISYPMETESSDIHKLAFTGMESFKPEHSYVDNSLSADNRFSDTLAKYPHIKHFRSQGLDCARNSGFCEYDSSYPKEYVNSIISNCSDSIDDMYIEMPENLADFNGYKSFIQVGRTQSRQSNTSLCDSERKYIRPSVIQDVNGHFYLILQSSFYFQQVPVEICTKPGLACNVVGRCNSQVKCTQKYHTHMLISIDTWESGHPHQSSSSSRSFQNHSSGNKPSNCPKMRMYRLPSSCVCELTRM